MFHPEKQEAFRTQKKFLNLESQYELVRMKNIKGS